MCIGVSRAFAARVLLVLALAGLPAGPAAADAESLLQILFDAPHRMRDSLFDMPPIAPVEKPFTGALAAAARGDLEAARAHAAAAGYDVTERSADGRDYLILVERDRAGIGPTIAVALNPARDVVIEAPHPVIDRRTDREAAVLFVRLGARALVLGGANRCAAKETSPCSGRTTVCGGGKNPYPTSDPAHEIATLFHVAHRTFTRLWKKSVVVQPHGFDNPGSSVWFVISDGSKERRPGDGMLTGRVRDAIRASLGRERAVSCQDPDDRDIRTRWHCATTTVQGRDLNGSGDACRKSAARSSGRFLHIEQTYREVRKAFGDDWRDLSGHPGSAAILAALMTELPCIEDGCAPVR